MEKPLFDLIKDLPSDTWLSETVGIRRIENDDDLWYAVAECSILPEQEEYVNPAGFSIGRAYLAPKDNVPCVICKADGERIGFIVLRKWSGSDRGFNWSYFIDRKFQGLGYGKAAAGLAVKFLEPPTPKCLSSFLPKPATSGLKSCIAPSDSQNRMSLTATTWFLYFAEKNVSFYPFFLPQSYKTVSAASETAGITAPSDLIIQLILASRSPVVRLSDETAANIISVNTAAAQSITPSAGSRTLSFLSKPFARVSIR